MLFWTFHCLGSSVNGTNKRFGVCFGWLLTRCHTCVLLVQRELSKPFHPHTEDAETPSGTPSTLVDELSNPHGMPFARLQPQLYVRSIKLPSLWFGACKWLFTNTVPCGCVIRQGASLGHACGSVYTCNHACRAPLVVCSRLTYDSGFLHTGTYRPAGLGGTRTRDHGEMPPQLY